MPLKELVTARETYEAKNAILAAALAAGKTDDPKVSDFSKIKTLGTEDVSGLDTPAKLEKIRTLNTEVMGLFDTMKALDTSDLDAAYQMRDADTKNRPNPMVHPQARQQDFEPGSEVKSLADWVGKDFREQIKAGNKRFTIGNEELYPSQIKELGLKTLFQTTAGWAPESTRQPGWVDAATRPIQVIDTIPAGRTSQAAIVYMLESTRTHAAAEKGEGLAYAESTFALTATTQTVRKITDSLPITDEQLDDVQQAETYLRSRLMFGLRQKLDSQILVGAGTGVTLEGANNVSSINTQAKGADPVPDAIYKGADKIRTVGFANPSVVYIHPTDWQGVRLLRTTDGMYIWGNPSEAGPMRIWGMPVVATTAQTENTALVMDNSPAMCMLFERAGVEVEAGWTGSQFTEGEQTLRAQMRAAMVWFRASAITTVTGI